MSILTTIKADVAKFFSNLQTSAGKFCAAFMKDFKEVPTVLQVVQNFINEAAPIVVAAVGIADPLADPAVSAVLATVQTGLAGLQAALTSALSGTSLLTGLQNFVATIPADLKSIDVKNPALAAEVEKIANFIVSEGAVLLPAVEDWVKKLAGSSAPGSS